MRQLQIMPSFDVVSEVDRMEVKNAIDQAQRELTSRFDFKGVQATIELDPKTGSGPPCRG